MLQCPICKSPVDAGAKTRPFCSKRCQQIDLSRWLVEGYSFAVPARPEEEESETPEGYGDAGGEAVEED